MEINSNSGHTHSERLMSQIEKMLVLSSTEMTAIDAIAVSIGPGSFTGIRIGLATAKGLAYAWGKPLIGVPTLDSLAYSATLSAGWVCPVLDAQKGNVYQALYRWEGGKMQNVWPVRVVSAEKAVADLAALDAPVLIQGDGVPFCEDALAPFRHRLIVAPVHGRLPKAGAVAALGLIALEQGGARDPVAVNPYYVRRPEAEELWEKRHGAQQ